MMNNSSIYIIIEKNNAYQNSIESKCRHYRLIALPNYCQNYSCYIYA